MINTRVTRLVDGKGVNAPLVGDLDGEGLARRNAFLDKFGPAPRRRGGQWFLFDGLVDDIVVDVNVIDGVSGRGTGVNPCDGLNFMELGFVSVGGAVCLQERKKQSL